MSERCNYCGFPLDTPKAAHDFIHQQGEALIAHRKEIKRLRDALTIIADAGGDDAFESRLLAQDALK